MHFNKNHSEILNEWHMVKKWMMMSMILFFPFLMIGQTNIDSLNKINEKNAINQRYGWTNYWNHGRYQFVPTTEEHHQRMQWFRQSRFGIIIHYGLYSVGGRHEWMMNKEQIPYQEYDKFIQGFTPKPGCTDEWILLAKEAGMKYAVFTTKHHEGYCLWNTSMTDYNSVKTGPKRDLVKEYTESCRKYGLKVGLYYSLADWHHPDGGKSKTDEAACKRFVDFTFGCARELCKNYGKIDIFWFDVPAPLSAEKWKAQAMIDSIRKWQPGIIVNDRTGLPGDFTTPEENENPQIERGRDWEMALTMTGSWGYVPAAPKEDYRSVRSAIKLLQTASAHGGNFLLNIGPAPDGTVSANDRNTFSHVGKWVSKNKEAIFGDMTMIDGYLNHPATGWWTMKGNIAYYWCHWWQPGELIIGGIKGKLLEASILENGQKLNFRQTDKQLLIQVPSRCPDKIAGISIIKLIFEQHPRQDIPFYPEN